MTSSHHSLWISVRLIFSSLAVLAILLAGAAAPARAADSQDEAALRRGLELREKGNDEAALGEFQRAYELRPSGRARAQMALAEQALGRWIEAEGHLAEALQRSREPWISRNAALLEQAMGDIREHLGSMELSGGQPGAEVRVNGRVVGNLPLGGPVRVEAGSVAVEVRAAGYLPVVRTIVVPAKGLARQPIVMVAVNINTGENPTPERALPPPIVDKPNDADKPPKRKHKSSGARTGAGVVVGVAGLGALGTGVGFHLLRESRANQFNRDLCVYSNGMVTGKEGCQSQYDSIQMARNVAIAGYIATPILLGVSAYLLFSGDSSDSDDEAAARNRRLACAPALGPGLTCAARF
jgi:hypothetical protein